MRDQMFPRQSYPIPYNHEPTSLVSNTAKALAVEKWGVITKNGDSGNQLASLTLKGVNRFNSDVRRNPNSLTLYWKLTDAAGTRTVALYKSQAMAVGDKVAEGSSVGDGAITLAAANASGITGTVTVTYTGDETDSGNQIVIEPRAVYAKVTVDTQPIRWWNDNTVPTATDGLYAIAGSVIELRSCEEIMNFRMIRQAGADASVSVIYYE